MGVFLAPSGKWQCPWLNKPTFERLYPVHFGIGLAVGEMRSDGEAAEMKAPLKVLTVSSHTTWDRGELPSFGEIPIAQTMTILSWT